MNKFKVYNSLFQENLQQIETYISCIEVQKNVLNELDSPLIKNDSFKNTKSYKENLKKITNSPVQYNAVIISLYGSYEAFISDIFKKFIELIFLNVDNYNMLPGKIKEKHIKKTGEFLTNSQRFQNYGLTSEVVINNLYNCINNSDDAKLNEELILSHGGNLRIERILELMLDCGFKKGLDNILYSDEHLNFLSRKHELNEEETKRFIKEKKKKKETFFVELNQLVEERNNVAHGWRSDNRIAYNIIKSDIIEFLKCFGFLFEKIILDEYYSFLYGINKLHKFDEAIEVYNNNILCINNINSKLKIGDYIFVKCEKSFKCLKILDLEIEGKKYEHIELENIQVGIKVDNKIKKNDQFYYWK